jgi:hypothetical protein
MQIAKAHRETVLQLNRERNRSVALEKEIATGRSVVGLLSISLTVVGCALAVALCGLLIGRKEGGAE